DYLRTPHQGQVVDYRDWGIALGRRFRALKLWFVLRRYGLDALRSMIRGHIAMAGDLAQHLRDDPAFELLAPPRLALLVFRYRPHGVAERDLDDLNERLLARLNDSGAIYLTRGKVN